MRFMASSLIARSLLPCTVAAVFLLGSCGSSPEVSDSQGGAPNTTQPKSDVAIASKPQKAELGLFTIDELFEADGGGCGMTLHPVDAALVAGPSEVGTSKQSEDLEPSEVSAEQKPGEFLLFHGLEGLPMLMKFNGSMVSFDFEEGKGDDFYGQRTSQTFSNADLDLTVTVDVELGALGEIESVEIPKGVVKLQGNTAIKEIQVQGDAGC